MVSSFADNDYGVKKKPKKWQSVEFTQGYGIKDLYF